MKNQLTKIVALGIVLANATQAQAGNILTDNTPKPIEFINAEENGADLIVSITSTHNIEYAQFSGLSGGILSKGPSVYIDGAAMFLMFKNTQGQAVFTQSLSSTEEGRFRETFRAANSVCPVELTVSRKLRRITKVQSKCISLSQAPNTNPES